VPKKSISGTALVLGNDFDAPIHHQLPPFFGTALQFVKSWIDPGLNGDPYADRPYLFGPLLSSANALRIGNQSSGPNDEKSLKEAEVIEEGEDTSDGKQLREELKIPKDGAGRQKFFLQEEHRTQFRFEQDRQYDFDFYNGYLDFNGKLLWFSLATDRPN